jgi:hypothetical protein
MEVAAAFEGFPPSLLRECYNRIFCTTYSFLPWKDRAPERVGEWIGTLLKKEEEEESLWRCFFRLIVSKVCVPKRPESHLVESFP